MSKELEALNIIKFNPDDVDGLQYLEAFKVVEKALQRLETIDNAKPSEALEIVKNLLNAGNSKKYLLNLSSSSIRLEIIKIGEALIKSQQDKIIADFIREHYKLSNDINENYLVLKKPITEEEHIKFKENL